MHPAADAVAKNILPTEQKILKNAVYAKTVSCIPTKRAVLCPTYVDVFEANMTFFIFIKVSLFMRVMSILYLVCAVGNADQLKND